MFDYQHLKREFDEQGFVIISKLFDLERVERLQKICHRILSQWRDEYLQSHHKFNKKNCSRLTELQYFYKHPIEFSYIFNTIADERILSILNSICQRQLLFEGAVYFFAPEERSWRGDWHRDGQIIAPDDATEKSRIFNSSFI